MAVRLLRASRLRSAASTPSIYPTLSSPFLRVQPPRTSLFFASRPFSTTSPKPTNATAKMSPTALINLAQNRRTIYKLNNKSPVPDAQIEELVNAAILNVPGSFNTQSTRLLVLLHAEHERLWDIVIDTFGELVKTGAVAEETWRGHTLPKLRGLRGAVGTTLFYEDPAHIKAFSEKFAIYKDHFQPWAEHSNAMHQYFLWTGLEALGFGANLQHYNPLIDSPVSKQWDVPSDWRLIGQLVFGGSEGSPSEKAQKPVEERVKIFGKL